MSRAAAYAEWIVANADKRGTPEFETVAAAYKAARAEEAPKERGLGERLAGIGEAALTVATGATGGALGLVGGTLGGLAGAVRTGKIGTREGARMVEEAASQGAQALTYAPRTEAGREALEPVAAVAQDLVPLAGLAPQVSAIGQGAQQAIQAGRIAAAGRLSRPAAPAAAMSEPAAPAAVSPAVEPTAAAMAAPVAAAPRMAAQEIAATARQASEGGMGAARAARVLATEAAPDPEKLAAARRLGIEDYLQPDHVTTSEAYRQVVAAIKANPQSQVALAERQGLTAVAERASSLIDEIGGTRDLSQLSQNIRTRLDQSVAKMDAQETALWGEYNRLVSPTRTVEVPETKAVLSSIAREMGGDEKAKLAMPAEARRVLSPLMGDAPVTHGYLDTARKQIGRAIQKNAGPFKDMETGQLKRFYAALTADQEAVATQQGGNALYTFQAAKYATKLRNGFQDDLTALFGRDLDRSFVASGGVGLPGAMAGLAKGDASQLGRLLAAVPADMRQQVVASGLSTVFQKAATRGELDFTGYMKWYEGIRKNRQAYAALAANLPLSAKKQLEALYRVSQGVSESLRARVTTGRSDLIRKEMMGEVDSTMERLYDVAKRYSVSLPAEAVATAAGAPGAGLAAGVASALTKGKPKSMAAVDELIASPEFLQMVKTPPGPKKQAAVKRMADSARFKRFVSVLGDPPEIANDREAWLIQATTLQQAGQQRQERRTLQ